MTRISRRTLLQGLGTSLALPWLPSLGAQAGEGSPRRLIVYFIPNGMWMEDFVPAQTGSGYTLPWLLEPLAPVRDKFTVLSGIDNESTAGEPHSAAMGALMSGRAVETELDDPIDMTITMDQVIANHLAGATRFPSLQLGSEADFVCDLSGNGASEAECAYLWNLSWADGNTPLIKATRPELVFERLFPQAGALGDAATQAKARSYDQSVLDAVTEDASALQARVGAADRQRLDQYLTGVRELEQRLAFSGERPTGCNTDADAWLAAHPVNAQSDVRSHVLHMHDLMTLALQCDQSRVLTYMLGNGRSDRPYPFLGVPDSHHGVSHHEGDPARIDAYRTICRWEMEQVSAFLQSLDAVVQPDGQTLLDSSAVLICGAISEPNAHNRRGIPVLVAGGCGGRLRMGTHLAVPRDTLMSSVHVSLMQAMGLATTTFGQRNSPAYTDLLV